MRALDPSDPAMFGRFTVTNSLSCLLRIALGCVDSMSRTWRVPNSQCWFNGDQPGVFPQFSLAGCVIDKIIGAPIWCSTTPWDFESTIRNRLIAIDRIAEGNADAAYRTLFDASPPYEMEVLTTKWRESSPQIQYHGWDAFDRHVADVHLLANELALKRF